MMLALQSHQCSDAEGENEMIDEIDATDHACRILCRIKIMFPMQVPSFIEAADTRWSRQFASDFCDCLNSYIRIVITALNP